MRNLLLVIFALCSLYASAQRESYNWIWGGCLPNSGSCDGYYRAGIMKFNDDSVVSMRAVDFQGSFYFGGATISNSEGDLLMAFNGKSLFDSSGNTLMEFPNAAFEDMIIGYRGYVFLKPNDSSNDYFLLSSYADIQIGYPNPLDNQLDTAFYLTRITANENGYSYSDPVRFDLPIDTKPGSIECCRHANGRDWWILKPGHRKNQYLRGLLTPTTFSLEPYYTDQDSIYTPFEWATFSSDGSKYFHWLGIPLAEMQVFDFDRCSGELSNLQTYSFQSFVPSDHSLQFTPFDISANASKIFMMRYNISIQNWECIQYDLNTSSYCIISDSLGMFHLTPNLQHMLSEGRYIQISPSQQNIPVAHLLRNPDLVGASSGFSENYYQLPAYDFSSSIQYRANHLLGPIDGSSCDTLGLDQLIIEHHPMGIPEKKNVSFSLFPNPGRTELHFSSNLSLPIHCSIRDSQGRSLLDLDFQESTFTLKNELIDLSSGIYFIELSNVTKHQRVMQKWVKMHD